MTKVSDKRNDKSKKPNQLRAVAFKPAQLGKKSEEERRGRKERKKGDRKKSERIFEHHLDRKKFNRPYRRDKETIKRIINESMNELLRVPKERKAPKAFEKEERQPK